jgi:NTE family protein
MSRDPVTDGTKGASGEHDEMRFANRDTGGEHLIVDGGMLSNFPVWPFDAEAPQWPTFELKLVQKYLRVRHL